PASIPSLGPATTPLHPLSLHDALPILRRAPPLVREARPRRAPGAGRVAAARAVLDPLPLGGDLRPRRLPPVGMLQRQREGHAHRDRKSTRLNSSHVKISYAVFCLKKKK